MLNRVAQLRADSNLTQRQLASMVNINYSVLSRIETGERPLKDDEVILLADFFKVTTDYLLGISSNPGLTKKDELDIQRQLEDMKRDFTRGTLRMSIDGQEIDDEIKEFILSNMENTLILAKIKAKEKFTPKKYKK